MRLHAITPYGREGGSSRVRVWSWLDHTGVSATVLPYLGHRNADPAYVARHPAGVLRAERALRRLAGQRPGNLLLHREATPLSRGGIESRLLRVAGLGVYDFDDALQCDHGEGSPVRRLFPKSTKALAAVRAADRVIAGNATLAAWAADHTDDVVVIPSCVSLGDYTRKETFAVGDPPVLGWIGSAGEEKQLLLIADALLTIHQRTGARLRIIGTTARSLGDLEAMTDRLAWSERAQAVGLAHFDVGLMPMIDAPYERGKCGYKLLQYGAAGVPALASPVGVNTHIQHRTQMAAPSTLDEWVDSLLLVLDADTGQRQKWGNRARTVVDQDFSYRVWRERWEAAVGLSDTNGQ